MVFYQIFTKKVFRLVTNYQALKIKKLFQFHTFQNTYAVLKTCLVRIFTLLLSSLCFYQYDYNNNTITVFY